MEPARDTAFWAGYVERLDVLQTPEGVVNLNVSGRRVTSPIHGFGKMWQKTYTIRLEGADVSPEQLVKVWKERFGDFWPRHARFHGSLAGITPGDVALINLRIGGMAMTTGVLVLYADDVSFTVMTPQGHQFSGFNTFSAEQDRGVTVAQIQALVRASDPIYELGMPVVGHRAEDAFWTSTLQSVAAHFGAQGNPVELRRVCVDSKRQWRHWKNVWHNAAVRSGLYLLATPARRLRKA
ncbi:MAG: hypothetical protein ACRDZO_14890 [Egibacteraceae bacterium]